MFSISWTEADGVVTKRRETVAGAIALVDDAVTCRRANVAIIDDRDMRPVSVKQLHQIAAQAARIASSATPRASSPMDGIVCL
jgi:hypothetical protein